MTVDDPRNGTPAREGHSGDGAPGVCEIRVYGPGDVEALALLLADAFADGPVPRHLVPDAEERHRSLLGYFRIYTEYVTSHGVAYGTAQMTGAALWLDMLGSRPPQIDDLHHRLADACGQWTPGFLALDQMLSGMHPQGRPHWYLMFLGVHPRWQNQVLGSRLLTHHHNILDDHRHAVYLDASSPDNRRLYQRHGYRDLAEPSRLPGGPPLWPMWRDPHPRPADR